MLGDDIMDGTHSLLGTLKHAAGNAIKGAALFGVVALAVAASAALVVTSGGIAAAYFLYGGTIANAATAAAVAGGAVVGATSLIPGGDEGWSIRKLFKRNQRPQESGTQTELMQNAPSRSPDSASPNPYWGGNRSIPPEGPSPASGSPAGGGSAGNHTYIDNSRHEYHSQPPVQPQAPQDADNSTSRASAANGTQFGDTAFPPKDRLMNDEPSQNPYFKPGKGMQSMQKGDVLGSESGLQK